MITWPGEILCAGCGHRLAADRRFRHGDVHQVMRCMALGCGMRDVPLKIPVTYVEVDIKPSEENPREAKLNGSPEQTSHRSA